MCYHNVRYDVMKHNQSHKKPVGDALTFQGHCVVPTQRAFYGADHYYNRQPLWARKAHKQSGYIEIKTPNGWIREHRYVMERFIGRKLNQDELVHHIDGNILNNNINNLQLMMRGEHIAHHNTGSVKSAETRKKISIAGQGCQNAYKLVLPSELIDAIKVGKTYKDMAHMFNVSKATIRNKMKEFCIKRNALK